MDKIKAFNKGCVFDEPVFDVFTDGEPSRWNITFTPNTVLSTAL